MLVIGNSKVHYADKVVEVQKQALSFSNPQIPYKWNTWIIYAAVCIAFLISIFFTSMET
jgi:hypothetical protein